MSSEVQTVSHFRVKYSKEAHEHRRVREQSELELQHPDVGLPEADEHTQQKLPAVKRSHFRVFKVGLGVLYLLILAGITIRYVSVTLEKEQLKIKYNQLRNNYSELHDRFLVKCPAEWVDFRRSCYFKSTEKKTWPESRRDCQNRGADLVIINSKEEQGFISELNMKEAFWIGLESNYKRKTGQHEWEWVDKSPLKEKFWAAGQEAPSHGFSAACCEANGNWTRSHSYEFQTWICEKLNSCFDACESLNNPTIPQTQPTSFH